MSKAKYTFEWEKIIECLDCPIIVHEWGSPLSCPLNNYELESPETKPDWCPLKESEVEE